MPEPRPGSIPVSVEPVDTVVLMRHRSGSSLRIRGTFGGERNR